MKNATPRTLEKTHRRATRYEVALTGPDGERITVGFTARTTRAGLVEVLQGRGDAILELTEITNDDRALFSSDPRWHVTFGDTGWTVGFTGYTERDVRVMFNESEND